MIRTGHQLTEAEIAAAYDAIPEAIVMPPYFYPEAVRFAGPVAGQRVLDGGCGTGALLGLLAAGGAAELHGLEMSPALAALAERRLGPRAAIRRGSLQAAWPYPAGGFDLVLLTEVIEHLARPEAALAEARRVLAPTGRLVVTFPNATAYQPFFRMAERRRGRGRWEAFLPWEHPAKTRQPIDTVYAFEEIQALLASSGLLVARIHGRESFPYLWNWMALEPNRLLRGLLRGLEGLRPAADRLCNAWGRVRGCYRLFVECRPRPAGGGGSGRA